MADWQKIKTEYITTDTSYRKLAAKYGVTYNVIGERSRAEKWGEARAQFRAKTVSKAIQQAGKKKVDKLVRICDLADKLLDKLEQAADELDKTIIVHKRKVETATTEETTEWKETGEAGTIDRAGLKQLASALKDLKEVQMLKTELDKEEQRARIENLRQRSNAGQDDDDETGVILLAPVMGGEDEQG